MNIHPSTDRGTNVLFFANMQSLHRHLRHHHNTHQVENWFSHRLRMMVAGSQVGEEHGEGQQAGRHQVLRPQLHRPHTKCRECLFVFLYLSPSSSSSSLSPLLYHDKLPGAIWVALPPRECR